MTSASARPINLLDELQSALEHGTVARRVETLRRVTDLFLRGAVEYSDEQIAVFDDVFNCLIQQIETSARSLLANRIAPIPTAPPRLIYTLAFDDAIEVAAPVLSQSARLNDTMLIENAKSKSQGHLLAISKRKVLSNAVTDVLVERGNNEVVESAVNNPGAEFSDKGFSQLLSRADGNDNLATCLGVRKGIPRPHYLKLIARASDSVRARLQAANPRAADDISAAVDEAAFDAGHGLRGISEQTARAQNLVKSLFDDGRLNEEQIASFAAAGKFEETSAAIAMCANVSVATVENMMIESRAEGLMILAKVSGLSWATLKLILAMRNAAGDDMGDINEHKASYSMLRPSTAQQVLRFYRMRQTTDQAEQIA
ncbi:MAG: hypothetical protein BGN84_01435 [Afipia sp. 62-7]|nr:DUF2336 domain-containing protein [Afipia sp.]OJU20561.1 MAG: hypothetical protein BGN84_01435 [Afipia sp. 62-7]